MTVGKGGACGLPVRIAARSGAGIRSSCVHLEAPTGPGPVARLSLYICEGPQVRFALSRDGVASAKPLLQLTPSDANRSESERAQTVKRTAAMLWGIVVLAATAAGAENEAKKAAGGKVAPKKKGLTWGIEEACKIDGDLRQYAQGFALGLMCAKGDDDLEACIEGMQRGQMWEVQPAPKEASKKPKEKKAEESPTEAGPRLVK